jgi:hypothetical protein
LRNEVSAERNENPIPTQSRKTLQKKKKKNCHSFTDPFFSRGSLAPHDGPLVSEDWGRTGRQNRFGCGFFFFFFWCHPIDGTGREVLVMVIIDDQPSRQMDRIQPIQLRVGSTSQNNGDEGAVQPGPH